MYMQSNKNIMQTVCIILSFLEATLKIKTNDFTVMYDLTPYIKILLQHIINIEIINERIYIFSTTVFKNWQSF